MVDQILQCGLYQVDSVVKPAESFVALIAEQTTNETCFVIVVYAQVPLAPFRLKADCTYTILLKEEHCILF